MVPPEFSAKGGLVRPVTGASGAGYSWEELRTWAWELGIAGSSSQFLVPSPVRRSSSEVVFALESMRGLPASDPLLCHLPTATRPLRRCCLEAGGEPAASYSHFLDGGRYWT